MSVLSREESVRALRSARPRDPFLRASFALVVCTVVFSWWFGDFNWSDFSNPRRLQNLERFLGEIRPFPLHDQPWDSALALSWAQSLFDSAGREASLKTLAISILAVLLAAAGGLALALLAARTLATEDAFLPDGRPVGRVVRMLWTGLRGTTRIALAFLRAIPEYVWAFLLLGIFGPGAWTAILALALHNAGILGRLGAETIENAHPQSFAALRAVGVSRTRITWVAILPSILPRLLLYLFYRWETCVREATVLGMLGITTLGFWIEDARTRGQYDALVFFVVLGVGIVMVGDLVSALIRLAVRRAS